MYVSGQNHDTISHTTDPDAIETFKYMDNKEYITVMPRVY